MQIAFRAPIEVQGSALSTAGQNCQGKSKHKIPSRKASLGSLVVLWSCCGAAKPFIFRRAAPFSGSLAPSGKID